MSVSPNGCRSAAPDTRHIFISSTSSSAVLQPTKENGLLIRLCHTNRVCPFSRAAHTDLRTLLRSAAAKRSSTPNIYVCDRTKRVIPPRSAIIIVRCVPTDSSPRCRPTIEPKQPKHPKHPKQPKRSQAAAAHKSNSTDRRRTGP